MNESSYTDMMNNIASYLDKYCGLAHDNRQEGGESVEDVLTELIHMNAPKDEQNGGVLIDDVMTNLTGGMVGGKNKTQSKPDLVEIAFKDVDMNLLEGGDAKKEQEQQATEEPTAEQANTEAIEAVANELSEQPTTEQVAEQQTKEQTETLAETPAIEHTAEQVNEEPTTTKQTIEEQTEETPATEQTENKPTIEQANGKTNNESSTSEDEDSNYSESSDDSYGSDDSDDSYDDTEPVNESFKGSAYEAFLKHYSEHELTNTMKGGDNKERIANSKIHILPMFPYLLRY